MLLGQVLYVLLNGSRSRDETVQFSRLALVSKRLMIDAGRHLIQKHTPTATHQPIQCLAHTTTHPIARLCVAWAIAFGHNILTPMHEPSAARTVRDFMALYHDGFRARLAMAREVHPDCQYTFHIVTRWVVHGTRAAESFQEKASRTGGELALHKFICIREAHQALLFLQRWAQLQKHSHGPHATCLMECGPSAPNMHRKWIIDLDGKLEDLQSLGFLDPGQPCLEEV